MRILFLVGHPPWPLTQGRSLRNFQILRYLARRHDLDVLCGYSQDIPTAWPAEVESLWHSLKAFPWPVRSTWQRIVGLHGSWPDLWQAHFSQDLIEEGRTLLRKEKTYGCIHVAGFEMFGCALAISESLNVPIPLILDEHNIEFRLQQSLGESREGFRLGLPYKIFNALQTRKLLREEERAWRKAAHVLTVSQEDRQDVLRLIKGDKVTLLPNAADRKGWKKSSDQESKPFQLSFIGKMDYRPNVLAMQWFCFEVLPQLQVSQPQVHLNIVGRDPTPEVLELGSLKGVTVTGFVEDLRPYYAPGTIAILPMFHGGGTRLKVFEAIMEGIPLVSTSLGISGIGLENGKHCLLAEDAQEFIQAITGLWNRQLDGERLIRESRIYIAENFDWSAHLPVLDRVFPQEGVSTGLHTGASRRSIS